MNDLSPIRDLVRNAYDMTTFVYVDIETIPTQSPAQIAAIKAGVKPPASIKKPESIEAWRKESGEAAGIEAEQRAKDEAERIQREADERAEVERQAAAEREAALQRQIEDQRRETEAAAQRERDRIEAERKAEADARAKREADQAHRDRIRDDIATSMNGFVGELEAGLIADAIMDGAIPHVFARL